MAFQFIHNGNRDPATRKLIRSHVMKGKNTGKTRLRSAHLEAGTGSHNLTSSSRSKPPAAYESPESVADKANFLTAPLGNTFSGFEFAWEVEPSMIELIHQFIYISHQAVYPIEFCKSVNDRTRQRLWFQCLLTDEAFFYSVLAMSEVCKDSFIGKQDTSPRALRYLSSTYRSIAQNIENGGVPSDSTIAAVMSMALHEDFRRQPSRSRVHIDALQRLIELRGGVKALEAVVLLQKVCRADIEFALHNGSCPRFYRDAFPRKIIQNMLDLSTTMMNGSDSEVQTCHHDIASVVADMMSVSNLFNNNHTSFKFEADTYQEILISICYRLLHAYPLGEDRPEISQEYVFPLGLLALMTTMLFQHGRSQTLSYDLLAALLRNLLLDKEIRPPIEEQIFLWLLFVGGISVFGAEDRDWLVHRIKISLRAMNVSSWKDALNEIKRFPWISVVHDGPGEQLWKAVVWE